MPYMLVAGAFSSTVMATFGYTGGLRGVRRILDPEVDEVDRKVAESKTYRRPISETIEQLGEGRGELETRLVVRELTIPGIYAPGHEERRRQRLLARYGIDVGEAQGTK
jgi:hypothetical protein